MAIYCPKGDCAVTISSITATSAYFKLVFSASSSSDATRYVKLWLGTSLYDTIERTTSSTTVTFSTTISGLKANTTYTWTAMLGWYKEDGTQDDLSEHKVSGSFTTLETKLDMEKWSWEKSNGEATTSMTKKAYQVLHGNRDPSEFSHYVWNDLVAKAAEMRSQKGYTWDTDYGNYPTASGCKVSAGETLSAKKYNGVRYNIGSVRATGISNVSPGDQITGYHIERLTDVINNIIDKP